MNPHETKIWDVAVVGAGAAGLMAAVTARRRELDVLLLDGQAKIGAKILMSGGTRSNVTNRIVTDKDFHSEDKKVLRAVLEAFRPEETVAFFKTLGVSLSCEPGGKYFPTTHSAKTVRDAFLREIHRTGICLTTSRKVRDVHFRSEGNLFFVSGDAFSYTARTVILATGGLSFPTTGSDGVGYTVAAAFGHTLERTTPSLTPLLSHDAQWQKLAGLALPVRLSLWANGKKAVSYEGPLLFTHNGYSGPAVLNMSRHWIRAAPAQTVKLAAQFLPLIDETEFRKTWADAVKHAPGRHIKTFLAAFLPERFVEVFLEKHNINSSRIMNQITRQDREAVIRSLFHFPLSVAGHAGYRKAEVTAGGIRLSEVRKTTLESRRCHGLFLAGEMLDVDGRIGGFNFQWAWASGYVAGTGAAAYVKAAASGRS